MTVRYPSYARRKQVAKHRDQVLKADVAASVGFVQEPVPVLEHDAPPWPPVAHGHRVEVFDLGKWANTGRTSAAFGPFLVLCGMCPWQAEHDDYGAAEAAQRAHYSKHYEAGETA